MRMEPMHSRLPPLLLPCCHAMLRPLHPHHAADDVEEGADERCRDIYEQRPAAEGEELLGVDRQEAT